MVDKIERNVHCNDDQQLYVIPAGHGGYSCLGYKNAARNLNRLVACFDKLQLKVPADIREVAANSDNLLGKVSVYQALRQLESLAQQIYKEVGQRFDAYLTDQLRGLEGCRVEVQAYGETYRFNVGKSMGYLPIHLEIKQRNSSGGVGCLDQYDSVKVISR